MDIKKIGMVLATIIASAIRLPISFIAAVFVKADQALIGLNCKLANAIGAEWWREALYWAQESNIRAAEYFVEYFEDLQEDLA